MDKFPFKHFFCSDIQRSDRTTYYIHFKEYAHRRPYHSNTGKELVETIFAFVRDRFPEHSFELDYDRDDSYEEFIYFREPKDDPELVRGILQALDALYDEHVVPHLIPKLMSIICKEFRDQEIFARSLMEYQRKHGYHKASSAVITYFRDLHHDVFCETIEL